MLHRAIEIEYKEGTTLDLTFRDGKVKRYDMASLFKKYPQLEALKDRRLFLSGKIYSGFGIIWNDELDIEAETIYEFGETVREEAPSPGIVAGDAVASARAEADISQKELARISGIDQSDISKIERGVANPSVSTLTRIAEALDSKLCISISKEEE